MARFVDWGQDAWCGLCTPVKQFVELQFSIVVLLFSWYSVCFSTDNDVVVCYLKDSEKGRYVVKNVTHPARLLLNVMDIGYWDVYIMGIAAFIHNS